MSVLRNVTEINGPDVIFLYLVKELLLCVDEHGHVFGRHSSTRDALLGFLASFADHQTVVTFPTGFIGPLCFRHLLTVQRVDKHTHRDVTQILANAVNVEKAVSLKCATETNFKSYTVLL